MNLCCGHVYVDSGITVNDCILEIEKATAMADKVAWVNKAWHSINVCPCCVAQLRKLKSAIMFGGDPTRLS
jgi:hypothetical protein